MASWFEATGPKDLSSNRNPDCEIAENTAFSSAQGEGGAPSKWVRNLKLEVTKQLAKPGEEQRASPRVFQYRKHPGTRQPLKSDRLEKQAGDSGDDAKPVAGTDSSEKPLPC